MVMTKWYEESPGVVSSKRLAGGVALTLGLFGKILVFAFALMPEHGADLSQANGIADGAVLVGASLLGLTALDAFKRGN